MKITLIKDQFTVKMVLKTIPYGNIIYVENTYSNNYVNIIKTNINNKENLKIKVI